ncbi:MAG: hypothetical protein GTO53_01470, partial [Planctomycetales bacterium]|nr:hypothetical protein [Planctomycetales bacterium]NIM07841.1 hypothetical protein [Planctomycetales bacterium]NIN07333.1 hypothetical protein [Planctomycetales bacterium]NIN76436.1 hypothetical protein [Planctomycetales bacterium]NIO33634.1 hypothetical protein [Planctomycetales bacterium]
MDEPFFYLGATALVGYFCWIWLADYRRNVRALADAALDQKPVADAIRLARQIGEDTLPGAMPVGLPTVGIAVVGTL